MSEGKRKQELMTTRFFNYSSVSQNWGSVFHFAYIMIILLSPNNFFMAVFSYEMMSGYMAFDFETDLEYTKKVIQNDWTMELQDENPFDDITSEGRDFIHKLIQPKSKDRLSAEDCFNHPWFQCRV